MTLVESKKMEPNSDLYYMEESVLLGTKPLTPLHPGPEWRIFRMSPLRVSCRSMTSRFPPFAFVELVSPYNKKNITRWLEDMNFMFEWQEQYLTSERSSIYIIGNMASIINPSI